MKNIAVHRAEGQAGPIDAQPFWLTTGTVITNVQLRTIVVSLDEAFVVPADGW